MSTWPFPVYYRYYEGLSGTSMAAPHVSGVLALLKQYYDEEYLLLITRLLEGTEPLSGLRYRCTSGGRLDLYGALTAVNSTLYARPARGLGFRCMVGGQVYESSRTITLTNFGTTAVDWTAAKTQDWLDMTPVSGTLQAKSSVSITISVNAAAQSLAAGEHTDTITFTNVSTSETTTREIPLNVYDGPIHVKPDGDDDNDGSSWLLAKKSVQGAVFEAVPGQEVWVAAGTYTEPIVMANGVLLFGGFAGTETTRDQRNIAANVTTLNPGKKPFVVNMNGLTDPRTTVDGFTMQMPEGAAGSGVDCRNATGTISHNTITDTVFGVYCANSPVIISNNTIARGSIRVYCSSGSPVIEDNVISGATGSPAIYCGSTADLTITGNAITGNSTSQSGAAIYLEGSGTVTDNTISGNHAGVSGGGIYCTGTGTRVISNNRIIGNTSTGSGAGVYAQGATTISGNVIAENTASCPGGGIYVTSGAVAVTGNTVASNTATVGGGIYFGSTSTATAHNNIVAFCSSGIGKATAASPVLANNDVFGNSSYDYSWGPSPTGTNGNISVDPGFLSVWEDDYHLAGTSSCLDVGYSSAPGIADTDIDGQDRVYNDTVDIGADEYSGEVQLQVATPSFNPDGGTFTTPQSVTITSDVGAVIRYTLDNTNPSEFSGSTYSTPVTVAPGNILKAKAWMTGRSPSSVKTAKYPGVPVSGVVYVDQSASGTHDGSSWDNAFLTVGQALAVAQAGSEVWVAAGTYTENLALPNGVALYGGFGGYEALRSQRDWKAWTTILDGNDAGSVVSIADAVDTRTRIDGFTIRNGQVTNPDFGAGICCDASTATIANNIITGNSALDPSHSAAGGGILGDHSVLTIANNTITGNGCEGSGGGIALRESSGAVVDNLIHTNSAYDGGGISISQCASFTIANNTIVSNTVINPTNSQGGTGAGIGCASSPVDIANNIIAWNVASLEGGGIMATGILYGQGAPIVHSNNVFENTGGDYINVTPDPGSISANPVFVSFAQKDLHIQPGSPCRDTGYNSIVEPDWVDTDGQPRIQPTGGTVDIGADEAVPPTPVDTPEFSPAGGVYNDAVEVSITCATPGATIRYTEDGSDPTETSDEYTGAITVAQSKTLKARGFRGDMSNSDVATQVYELKVVTPEFNPPAGPYKTAQSVEIACDTPDAVIHYTEDGSDPTPLSPAYTEPITVSTQAMLKAIAVKPGWTNSDIAAAEYQIIQIVYVKPDAPGPIHDGRTWDTAKLTIQAGIDAAPVGGEVWVVAGTYNEKPIVKNGVALYGGFAGSETLRTDRNWTQNHTILTGTSGDIVTVQPGDSPDTVVDGFEITGGWSSPTRGIYVSSASATIANNKITNMGNGGILCEQGADIVITDNTIQNNQTTDRGAGICSWTLGHLTVTRNVISGNHAQDEGGGILAGSGTAYIAENTITSNSAWAGAGICCWATDLSTITRNRISDNTGYWADSAAGILTTSSTAIINNNWIVRNGGGGIYCDDQCDQYIINNTIADNYEGSGIDLELDASVLVENNIITGNRPGIYVNTERYVQVTLRNNDVYGNGLADYQGANPGQGDISTDAFFVNQPSGNYHIGTSSPCIDAAYGDEANVPLIDVDGEPRFLASVDIGADEYYSILRVKPTGSDSNNGFSWAAAKQTIQAAINAATVPAEVWVAAGTYTGNVTLKEGVKVYGGFAGTETTRDQRNWATNVTTIDAGGSLSAVAVPVGTTRGTVIDGFTITGGNYYMGGGIFCVGSASPTISHNIIRGNHAQYSGGAISIDSGSPLVGNNIITANICDNGGVIYSGTGAASFIGNSVVANNGQGGIRLNGSPTIANNIVAFNGSGSGICYVAGTPTIRYNDCFGNIPSNYQGITDPTGTNGNISLDPRFAGFTDGDFHIRPDSPCLDAGDINQVAEGDLDIDKDERILPVGGIVDIGADESAGNNYISLLRRTIPNGTEVSLGPVSVTACFLEADPSGKNWVYVEQTNRTSGIRVNTPGGFSVGDLVNVSGTMQTDAVNGERYIEADPDSPQFAGSTLTIGSIGMRNEWLGGGPSGMEPALKDGFGFYNVGMLVQSWGQVNCLHYQTGHFYMNDGSNLHDGAYTGVRVILPEGASMPALGSYVKVTAICSTKSINGQYVRVLRPRTGADIQTVTTWTDVPLDLSPGQWNSRALTGIPRYSHPENVFVACPSCPGLLLDGYLKHYDPLNQSWITYSPCGWPFYCLLAEGYLLYVPPGGTNCYNYQRTIATADQMISLPRGTTPEGDYSCVGNPFSWARSWASCKVTDGASVVSLPDAIALGWIHKVCYWNDTAWTPVADISTGSFFAERAYLIYPASNNLAIIVPE